MRRHLGIKIFDSILEARAALDSQSNDGLTPGDVHIVQMQDGQPSFSVQIARNRSVCECYTLVDAVLIARMWMREKLA